MPADTNHKKKSPNNKFWNFSIWNSLNQTIVREIDASWNPVYDSTLLMYQKLKDLGFTYRDGEIKPP